MLDRGTGKVVAFAQGSVVIDQEFWAQEQRDALHARRGVGQALLDRIIGIARERGYRRVLLETGTGETFEPANRLYLRNGFTRCAPFGEYAETDFNIFYELAL